MEWEKWAKSSGNCPYLKTNITDFHISVSLSFLLLAELVESMLKRCWLPCVSSLWWCWLFRWHLIHLNVFRFPPQFTQIASTYRCRWPSIISYKAYRPSLWLCESDFSSDSQFYNIVSTKRRRWQICFEHHLHDSLRANECHRIHCVIKICFASVSILFPFTSKS